MKHKLLIVDDEPANLRMLERLFKEEYEPISAESGQQGLERLAETDVAVIISDQRMPGMTGIEFLKRAAQMRRQTVRIILTGYTDVSDLVDAINSGVIYRYITKPWVNHDLSQTVTRAVEHYESSKKQSLMAQENVELEQRLRLTVQGCVGAVRELIIQKSSNLSEHCRRTSDYAQAMAKHFNMGPEDTAKLVFAAILHEVPNMRLPFEMDLNKAALTEDQLRVTRTRYDNGLRVIAGVPDLADVALIISCQHEHFDGSGFFEGLAGDKIPLGSRILAVANAFDEINSGRNPALFCTDEEAADWLRKRSGTTFDPRVVEACLGMEMQATIGLQNGHKPAISGPGAAARL